MNNIIDKVHSFSVEDHEYYKDVVFTAINQANLINGNGFASTNNDYAATLHKRDNRWFQIPKLLKLVDELYKQITNDTVAHDYKNYWVNIYYPKGSQGRHFHYDPTTVAGWCYFLHVPENSGIFLTDDQTEYTEEGKIILFPSDLWHEVTENKSKDNRITISGNIQKTS